MSRWWIVAGSSLALLVVSTCALAQQRWLGTDTDNAAGFRMQLGRRVTYVCPANVAIVNSLWGDDPYSDDSRICLAARHAGVLKPGEANAVTLVMGPGVPALYASTQNGVTSQGYDRAVPATFRFDRSVPGQLDWTTTAEGVPADFSIPVVLRCPAMGVLERNVYGTSPYANESSICGAAVHAGVITLAQGGTITLTMAAGAVSYPENERNGVRSRPYSNGAASFTVSSAAPSSMPSAAGPTGLIVTADPQGLASVRWDGVPGATYFAMRWRVGDDVCCNATSPPGAPLTRASWVDGPLPGAGTYGYRVLTTGASGISATQTEFVWAGPPAQSTATGVPQRGTVVTQRQPTAVPAPVSPVDPLTPGPEVTFAAVDFARYNWGAMVLWSPVTDATAYRVWRSRRQTIRTLEEALAGAELVGTVSSADAAMLAAAAHPDYPNLIGAFDPAFAAYYWVEAVFAGGSLSQPGAIAATSLPPIPLFGLYPPFVPGLLARVGGTTTVTLRDGTRTRGNRVTWTWDQFATGSGYGKVYRYGVAVTFAPPARGQTFPPTTSVFDTVSVAEPSPFAILWDRGTVGPPYSMDLPAGSTVNFCVTQFPFDTGMRTLSSTDGRPLYSCVQSVLPP